MVKKDATYTWKGKYVFKVNGSGLHEDTLRIKSNYRKQEQMLRLSFPTLCITYADVRFQNSIGGEQKNYPASKTYGPAYFDLPIEILGEEDVEKYTYIRGAQRVEIGPKETIIEFPSWNTLVIPRLRIDQKKSAEFCLHVPETQIFVDEPLRICALQYADGRHIGGVRLEKQHPKWQPTEEKETYNLWIRVIDGVSLQPVPEVQVEILHWDPKAKTPFGVGGFHLDDCRCTDGSGCIQVLNRPSGELEAYVVRRPGWRAVVRCLKPLAGQKVRLHMRVWPLIKDSLRYTWKVGDTLDGIIRMTGYSMGDILQMNRLKDASELKSGMQIILPCYAGTYNIEQWDSLDWVGETFGYGNAKGLAEVNGFKDLASLGSGMNIKLPDWRFFYARERDNLEEIDSMFGLPKGSTITVGRVYHPDPRLPYAGETVGVPTPRFADILKKRKP